ncbi:MAG: molybdenum cofactor guanylyltransferase [Verrucomicrobia bacterium]|nr:molybdenum cofactor guanylyltransferase [Verrucomicrobiota bacterium]
MEVCILAGGRSSRMGRDKSKLRLGGGTLLRHVKSAAALLHCPTRIIRHDLVPRRGPLGGIYTALKTTRARRIVFLCCDMPLVPSSLLRRLLSKSRSKVLSVFTRHDRVFGFPFLLKFEALGAVEKLLQSGQFALQELAAELNAGTVRPRRQEAALLLNVNTPADWDRCRRLWKRKRPTKA